MSKTTTVRIGRLDIDTKEFNEAPNPDNLPILATRNLVLFPGVTIPISLTREYTLELARRAADERFPIGIVCQKNPDEEHPTVSKGLRRMGVVGYVYQILELPDETYTALVHGTQRFRILGSAPSAKGELNARIQLLEEKEVVDAEHYAEVMETLTSVSEELVKRTFNGEMAMVNAIRGVSSLPERTNFIATNFPLDPTSKIQVLAKNDPEQRAIALLSLLLNEKKRVDVTQDILKQATEKMQETQRSTFLQMQMEAIKEELYGGNDEDDPADVLASRAEKLAFPAEVRSAFNKELAKLRRINQQTPDYAVQHSYLETLCELPWGAPSETNSDINKAVEVLDNDHYGLEKVKQRILEQIAVVMNNPKAKSPIICLVGPPGVGKTSLGASIAKAMGRKYERVSLGGLHDEAEIRGHRRTYIGALPGRIIKAMKAAGTTNPVLLLDEVDKIGKDYKGDPASALLEVLDPEQNVNFHDNYIDLDYDLSNVLFIATANNSSTIETPLLDRMEVINLSGYLLEEKIEIARRHLMPKVLKANGWDDDDMPFHISDESLTYLIENYTAESGVRRLENVLGTLVRKAILAKLRNKPMAEDLQPDDLRELLGLPLYNKDKYEGNDFPGVVTGLAWTQVGGEILLAEASLSPGKGDRLTITGNLGDVMKESATIALQWVKAHCAQLNIPAEAFEKFNLHIHFPEGAIPKDGPSAGITVATAIASAFTGRKVRERIAMTGEITLRGRVLPVGGIKEKILAAKRAGITTIVLSTENRRDIEDIPANYTVGLTFHYVDTMTQVADFALL